MLDLIARSTEYSVANVLYPSREMTTISVHILWEGFLHGCWITDSVKDDHISICKANGKQKSFKFVRVRNHCSDILLPRQEVFREFECPVAFKMNLTWKVSRITVPIRPF